MPKCSAGAQWTKANASRQSVSSASGDGSNRRSTWRPLLGPRPAPAVVPPEPAPPATAYRIRPPAPAASGRIPERQSGTAIRQMRRWPRASLCAGRSGRRREASASKTHPRPEIGLGTGRPAAARPAGQPPADPPAETETFAAPRRRCSASSPGSDARPSCPGPPTGQSRRDRPRRGRAPSGPGDRDNGNRPARPRPGTIAESRWPRGAEYRRRTNPAPDRGGGAVAAAAIDWPRRTSARIRPPKHQAAMPPNAATRT